MSLSLSDTDLLDIATQFRDAIVRDRPSTFYCGLVCRPLAGYLAFLGLNVDTKEIRGSRGNHMYLLLPDGRVLDPTADQYDATLPKVYLGPKLAIHRPKHRPLPHPRSPHA